ncbi:MAG: CDP-alcohol phosphatidyltransferase family protein [Candidatus Tectomicrobia bacterium]|uniref:CDP-diacylglycerol--glycerol-3-phosphate 3-phosphatidyltransferase n=1 Tax=Tectimicrobiota bacterium TaxID=2528274 RepID=A0A932CMX2_UNCTE|nr:CDP-alcohol phosphatidyltransferase family protein [Candidatus Tectomicrobia bacterium]
MKPSIINLANAITLLRIILVPFFVYALIYEYRLLALITFCTSALSDGIDGFIARMKHQKTELGTILDPLADKLLLTTSYVTLAILHVAPAWLALIVVSRDLLILMGAMIIHLLTGHLTISPTIWGKITTFLQLLTILLALLLYFWGQRSPWMERAALLTALFTIISGLHYTYQGLSMLNGSRK